MDCPPGQKKSGRCREVAVSGGSTVVGYSFSAHAPCSPITTKRFIDVQQQETIDLIKGLEAILMGRQTRLEITVFLWKPYVK